MYNHQKGFASEWDVPYQIQLTGQFVDMPDGRWHYVFIKDELRLIPLYFRGDFSAKSLWKMNLSSILKRCSDMNQPKIK